eukprot:6464890-Amphidinium_carterae.4
MGGESGETSNSNVAGNSNGLIEELPSPDLKEAHRFINAKQPVISSTFREELVLPTIETDYPCLGHCGLRESLLLRCCQLADNRDVIARLPNSRGSCFDGSDFPALRFDGALSQHFVSMVHLICSDEFLEIFTRLGKNIYKDGLIIDGASYDIRSRQTISNCRKSHWKSSLRTCLIMKVILSEEKASPREEVKGSVHVSRAYKATK